MHYRLLGPLEVFSDDGTQVPISGERERVLLATLLLGANHVVSSGRLIEAIWGDQEPPTATNALQVHVSKLRRKLGDAAGGESPLRTSSPGYVLTVAAGELDLQVFESLLEEANDEPQAAALRLREALAVWRGSALVDVDSILLLGDRIRLVELHAATVERRIDADLACGRHLEVIAELEGLIHANPLRESLRRQLMLALYRAGRQADALACYGEVKDRLAGDLGVDPGPELQTLELAILQQDEAIAAPIVQSVRLGQSQRSQLPVYLTSFVARDAELGVVRDLMTSSRLITVTGPGGCGKTRLAVQVADATEATAMDRPVWFVDLSQLGNDRFVAAAVASVLGLSEEPGQAVTETIASWIGDREALLLVDNCEHLIDAVAKVIDSLLRACPGLSVLATSREPLGVDGERAYRVPSLAYPAETESASSTQLANYPSIELLVHRAMDHDPTFEVSPSSMPAVASICRRLDGIPLAIELVSGRLSSMSPEEVERRLDDRFQLLTGGSRTALPRQQTLAASIDWSYDLLDPAQQAVLLRASTMSGSFDLVAAEAVCNSGDVSEGEVSRVIGALVERNLVRLERADEAFRYRLAETIREYAAEKLQQLGADAVATSRCRHALHFARWLEGRNTPPVWGFVPHTLAYLDERGRVLARETSNLITASYHAIVYGAAADDVLRLAYGAGIALVDAHQYAEAVDVFARALSATPDGSSLRGQVQRFYATSLIYMGRYDDGKTVLESARVSSLEAGRLDEVLAVDQNLCFVANLRGDDSVRQIIEGLVCIATESGDDDLIAFARASRGTYPVHFGQAMCLDDLRSAVTHFRRTGLEGDYISALGWLAGVELEVGDLLAAKLHFEETLLARSANMAIGHLLAHLSLALIELEQGNVSGAVRRWEVAAVVIESRCIAPYYILCVLVGALCCEAAGHEELAARLFGTTDSIVRESGERLEPYEAKCRERSVSLLQTALGPDEFERLRLEGEELSFVEAQSMAHTALGSVGAVF